MRLCVPIPCFFGDMDFCEGLRRVKALGYDAAETYNWKGLDFDAVRRTCEETGVELLSMCTSEFRMTDPTFRQAWLDGLEESWIYGVELKPDFSGIIGEPVLLLRPEQPWEGRSAAATGRRWNEGSFLMKAGDRYLMTYSGNYFGGPDYAVGYAVGQSPLGPFVKAAENPILERYGDVTGTGHSCMLHSPEGELLICYYGRTEKTGQDRVGFISPAEVTPEGRLIIHP